MFLSLSSPSLPLSLKPVSMSSGENKKNMTRKDSDWPRLRHMPILRLITVAREYSALIGLAGASFLPSDKHTVRELSQI